MEVSPPVRILALVLVLVGAAGMMALRVTGPSVAQDSAPVAPTPHRQAVAATAAKPAAKAKAAARKTIAKAPVAKSQPKQHAAAKPAARPAPARAAAPKPRPAPKVPEPKTGFPVAVDQALANHELVVVSLVVPGARVDLLAAAEAEAGAKLTGAGYLALNVLNENVAHKLLVKLGTLEDSTLLLVNRRGEVALKLTGFVDRDSVAQAAANAST